MRRSAAQNVKPSNSDKIPPTNGCPCAASTLAIACSRLVNSHRRLRIEPSGCFLNICRGREAFQPQWLVTSLIPKVTSAIAIANKRTPITTVQISRSVGYGLTAFCMTTAGGSRRIRDGRASTALRRIFERLILITGRYLRARDYRAVTSHPNEFVRPRSRRDIQDRCVRLAYPGLRAVRDFGGP